MNERNKQIDNFIEKWDEMLKAATEIDGFTWKFSVTITSSTAIAEDRVRTINGINESFTKHDMEWSSSNN